MHLLITRPEQDAGGLATALEEQGHSVRLEPLIAIVPDTEIVLPERAYQAVLVTSANGVRALAAASGFERFREVPALAVGHASAQAAREAGFAQVLDAAGDLSDLVRLVRATCEPSGGPLFYAAGKVVSGDLKALLEAEGYEVDRLALYDAVPADRLTPGLAAALEAGEIDGVLLFSPRTARIWAGLAGETALGVTHYCLSQAVADALEATLGTAPRSVRVAERPNQDALTALIGGA